MENKTVEIGGIKFEKKEWCEQFYVYVEDRRPNICNSIEEATASYNRAKKRGYDVTMRRIVTQYWDMVEE